MIDDKVTLTSTWILRVFCPTIAVLAVGTGIVALMNGLYSLAVINAVLIAVDLFLTWVTWRRLC